MEIDIGIGKIVIGNLGVWYGLYRNIFINVKILI